MATKKFEHGTDFIYKDNERGRSVHVRGKPYGRSKKKITNEYKRRDITKFLRIERAQSAGDYVLVDDRSKDTRVITSSAFSGGFIYNGEGVSIFRTLGSLVKATNNEKIDINVPAFEKYMLHHVTQRPALTGLFENVLRLPPKTHLKINNGSVSEFKYYGKKENRIKNKNIGRVLEKTLEKVSDNEKIAVMYSGGIDSTSLYIILKNVLQKSDVTPVTVDIDQSTNSVENARLIGEVFDINTKVVPFNWPPQDKDVIDIISSRMKEDIVDPELPHWPVLKYFPNSVIISGQSMGSILTGGMSAMQAYDYNNIYSLKLLYKYLRVTLKNTMFTDLYEKNEFIKMLYNVILRFYTSEKYCIRSGRYGHYLGLMSTETPNKVRKETEKFVRSELKRFLEIIDYDGNSLTDVTRFFLKHQNVAKQISSHVVNGSKVEEPSLWQPFNTYAMSQDKNISDAFFPKRELNKYLENKMGIDYHKINNRIRDNDPSLDKRHQISEMSPLVSRYIDVINPKNSVICKVSNCSTVRHILTNIYNKRDAVDYNFIKSARKLINLELILRQ